jgi:outer membrane immunogenic protein
MRKLGLIAAAAALFAGPAVAADMTLAPVPPPVFTWTGCYGGVNGGGGWADKSFRNAATSADFGGHTGSGGTAGGQIGCDYQSGLFVAGLQGMIDGIDARNENNIPGTTNVITSKVQWLTTLTGRFGFAATPASLIYAKGGVAWVGDVHSIRNAANLTLVNGQTTRSGWTAGLGWEWNFWGNVSVFAEYDYFDFGSRGMLLTPTPGGFPAGVTVDVKQNVNVFLVGLNLRFGPPAIPVRY